MFDLTRKVAVITGSSRGLGREMALEFARRGATVVVASRKVEACDSGGQGRAECFDCWACPHVWSGGASERNHAWPVPDRHLQGVGHGSVQCKRQDTHSASKGRRTKRDRRSCVVSGQRRIKLHDRVDPQGRRRNELVNLLTLLSFWLCPGSDPGLGTASSTGHGPEHRQFGRFRCVS